MDMNDHSKQVRKNLIQLVEFANVDISKVDMDSEVPKWPHKYLEEFCEALPMLDEEKIVYILKGIFEKNLITKIMKSYNLKKDTCDKFSDYNRRIFERMDELGINVEAWVNSKLHKRIHVKDNSGVAHEIIIGPIHDAMDAREHLLLGNPHTTKDFCTVIRKSNTDGRSHPDVHLDYLLDCSVRSINVFSKTLNDSIGYVPLVAAEDENESPVLGMSFMVFMEKFKNNPDLVSGVLDFLSKDPNYTKNLGFKSAELSYCCDFSNINNFVQKSLNDVLNLVKARSRELEKKGKADFSDNEKEIHKELLLYQIQIEDFLKNEVYTKKSMRNKLLKKIGMSDLGDYETNWQGTTYLDLWGIDKPVYGPTMGSVECIKGFNYRKILDFCEDLKKLKKLNYN